MCKNWKEKGTCRYGDKCLFAHGEHELTRKKSGEDQSLACKSEASNKAEEKFELEVIVKAEESAVLNSESSVENTSQERESKESLSENQTKDVDRSASYSTPVKKKKERTQGHPNSEQHERGKNSSAAKRLKIFEEITSPSDTTATVTNSTSMIQTPASRIDT
jgi:hypothetical protein